MSYSHSNVYVVRVTDASPAGGVDVWLVGPYGSTRAERVADHLEEVARTRGGVERSCIVQALFSHEDCLRVADEDRAVHGSLI